MGCRELCTAVTAELVRSGVKGRGAVVNVVLLVPLDTFWTRMPFSSLGASAEDIPHACLPKSRTMSATEMFGYAKAFKVAKCVVGLVLIAMMDMRTIRDRAVSCFPDQPMQADAIALKILPA